MVDWIPDVLGAEFEQLTLELGEDDEGAVIAALVRALPPAQGWWERLWGRRRPLDGVDVLYVHGWSGYFFQKRLARFWTARGARFFASTGAACATGRRPATSSTSRPMTRTSPRPSK